MTPTRHLDFPNCYNARDLGGLPTLDGGRTRWGAVVRADLLSRLTDEGVQALRDHGIRTIVDLREPGEVAAEPSIFFDNADETIRYLNRPLENRRPEVSALIEQAQTRAEVYCLVLDHYPKLVASTMRAIADAPPGGVLIHCHAGKDRTGMVAALLLGLAGVPDDVIIEDYALSQERLRPLWALMIEEVGGEENANFWLKPTATAEMMHDTLDHLRQRYGGVREYLLEIGLSEEELARLQQRLLAK